METLIKTAAIRQCRKSIYLKLSTAGNGNGLLRFAALGTKWFNLLDDIHTFDDGTENDMTVIQPWGFHGCNEELRTVCVWSSVCLIDKSAKKGPNLLSFIE